MSYAMLCGDHHALLPVPPRALLLLPHSWQVALDVLAW